MIFRKNRPEETSYPARDEAAAPAQEVAAPAVTETAAPAVAGQSVLTSDVVMEGNLVTSGDLHIDGTVHGAVQAQRVLVDTNGTINGQLVAQEVEIHGRVIGPICAVRIRLVPGGQVEGDVLVQSICVDEGAFIDGQIRHSEDPLGEWQQMWYGDEVAEDAAAEDAAMEPEAAMQEDMQEQMAADDAAGLTSYLRRSTATDDAGNAETVPEGDADDKDAEETGAQARPS